MLTTWRTLSTAVLEEFLVFAGLKPSFVATYMSNASGVRGTTETSEMDWSHSLEASRWHYMTSLDLQPRPENEKRTNKK